MNGTKTTGGLALAVLATLLVVACEAAPEGDDSAGGQAPTDTATTQGTGVMPGATVALRDAQGRDVGTATLEGANGGASVQVTVRGIAPGQHGVHVHMVGRCDAPDFASAGDHWNPTGAKHGLDNPNGPHAGDLPNLEVADDSTGTLTFASPNLRLDGDASVLDADGAALVVHAQRDDQTTDPSGDSGDRIACGVITRR